MANRPRRKCVECGAKSYGERCALHAKPRQRTWNTGISRYDELASDSWWAGTDRQTFRQRLSEHAQRMNRTGPNYRPRDAE